MLSSALNTVFVNGQFCVKSGACGRFESDTVVFLPVAISPLLLKCIILKSATCCWLQVPHCHRLLGVRRVCGGYCWQRNVCRSGTIIGALLPSRLCRECMRNVVWLIHDAARGWWRPQRPVYVCRCGVSANVRLADNYLCTPWYFAHNYGWHRSECVVPAVAHIKTPSDDALFYTKRAWDEDDHIFMKDLCQI